MAEEWGFRQGAGSFRPVRELEEMRRRFEDDIVRPVMRAVWERIPEDVKGWSPAVDVFERGDTLVVKIELPGVRQEEVELSASDDALTVRGQRNPEAGVKDADYNRHEIAYGSFYRSVALPANVDTGKVEAVYQDGILEVTLQRAAGTKPKKVNIQVKKSA
jgi:HSP20 family protein